MVGLPAHCDKCGHTFIYEGAQFSNIQNATLRGNLVRCPKCSSMARAIDGTFEFLDNAIRVKDASPRTIAILATLQKALRDVQAGKDAKDVIAEIEKEAPEFAAAAHSAIGKGGVLMLIAMLLGSLAYCSSNVHQTLDWNQLIDQTHVYTTGGVPYPELGQKGGSQSESEQTATPNRQQRRYKERQAKKQPQPSERRKPKKPKKR